MVDIVTITPNPAVDLSGFRRQDFARRKASRHIGT